MCLDSGMEIMLVLRHAMVNSQLAPQEYVWIIFIYRISMLGFSSATNSYQNDLLWTVIHVE